MIRFNSKNFENVQVVLMESPRHSMPTPSFAMKIIDPRLSLFKDDGIPMQMIKQEIYQRCSDIYERQDSFDNLRLAKIVLDVYEEENWND